MVDWRSIPVPERMKALPRDHRGFPIFAMAYRDASGRAHFTVNDEDIRRRMVRQDRCSICDGRLLRGRWFIGGPGSAFHPHGAYLDPPMHSECAHYALHVCPYLAAPNYASLIGGATVAPDDAIRLVNPTAIVSPSTADEVRPDVFVAVLARGQRAELNDVGYVLFPMRPYITVQYWRHGHHIGEVEGFETCWLTKNACAPRSTPVIALTAIIEASCSVPAAAHRSISSAAMLGAFPLSWRNASPKRRDGGADNWGYEP